MKRKYLPFIIVIIVLVAGVTTWFVWHRASTKSKVATVKSNAAAKTAALTEEAENKSIRLIATGDFIAHDAINKEAKKTDGTYDYSEMWANMKPVFTEADIRFCNQATPAGGKEFGISGYPVFNAPLEWTSGMADLGCNLINVGSNHSNDRGQEVIDGTRNGWDKQANILGIAGANRSADEQQKISYFTTKGVKFAFLSYVTYSNTHNMTAYGVNMFSRTTAAAQLADARKNADIVIVSMRWGTEYSNGINAEQATDSQFLSDNGADIVFGHGTHFLEPVKQLTGVGGRKTWVWYSLGNFLNAQIEEGALFGIIAAIDIDTATKEILPPSYYQIYIHYEWTTAQAKAQDLLSRHNFQMYFLDDAAAPLAKSQHQTTVDFQKLHIQNLLNMYVKVSPRSNHEL